MTEMKFNSIEDILDFAISEEAAAATWYRELAAKMDKPWMKKVLEGFAREEDGHKAKLENVKKGKIFVPVAQKSIQDLKIAEYVVEPETTEDLDYQHALIFAMKKEKAAFKMYSDLAELAQDDNVKELFLALAQEEAKHKLRFEVEYDDRVLTEN